MSRIIRWLALAALATGCGGAGEQPSASLAEPRMIPAMRVGAGATRSTYRAAGVVRALRRAELGTRIMGRVETVRVRAGDRVRAGQVLASFDPASVLAARQQSGAARELAQTNLRRMERLYADSAIPVAQLEAARAAFAQAEGQAGAATAELSYTRLIAPFAGVITARMADPGDLAAPGQALLVIEDDGPREIVVSAPDRIADQVRIGQAIQVGVGAEERSVQARVATIVPAADPMTRTVEIRLTTSEHLRSNLTAIAELPVEGATAVTIPAAAIVERGQLTGVFLFSSDSTVRLRWVRLGRRTPRGVAVASGLTPADLISPNPAGLRDGERALPALPVGSEP